MQLVNNTDIDSRKAAAAVIMGSNLDHSGPILPASLRLGLLTTAEATVSTVAAAYYNTVKHYRVIMKFPRKPATKATSGSENLSIITGRRTTGSSSPPQEITAPVSVILNETMKGKYQSDITSSVQLRSLTRFKYFCDHIVCSNIYHHVGGKIVLPQINEVPITLSGLLCK